MIATVAIVNCAVVTALEWLDPSGILLFALDFFLVSQLAGLVTWSVRSQFHPQISAICFSVAFVWIIISTAALLSIFDRLSDTGFLVAHLVAIVPFILNRQARQCTIRANKAGARMLTKTLRLISRDRLLLAMFCLIGLVLAGYLAFGIVAFPANYDSQTYRFSRVGTWLANGSLGYFNSNDLRHLYMPFFGEILIAYPVSFFSTGYPLSTLAQFAGGITLICSCWILGGVLGLDLRLRAVAILALLGMPNVLLQFATSQTDLLAAGYLNAGLACLWYSLKDRRLSMAVLAGSALAIAIGTKSTFAYWLPGLLIWGLASVFTLRTSFGWALRSTGLMLVVTLLLGGYAYVHNVATLGHPFADSASLQRIHQSSDGTVQDRVAYIAKLHLWQSLKPQSNPRFLEPFIATFRTEVENSLVDHAPTEKFANDFAGIRRLFHQGRLHEDIVSFGIVPLLLAVAGGIAGTFANNGRLRIVSLGMVGSLIVLFTFFFTQQNPNAWNFRFFILAAPFISVLGCVIFRHLRFGRRVLLPCYLLLIGANIYESTTQNVLGGLRAITDPQSIGHPASIFSKLTNLARLGRANEDEHVLGVALPENAWLSPYFRNGGGRRVVFIDPEVALSILEGAIETNEVDRIILRRNVPVKLNERSLWQIVRSENELPPNFQAILYELKETAESDLPSVPRN